MIVHTCNPRGRGREEDHKFEVSLGCIKRPYLKKKKKKKNEKKKNKNKISMLQ
jgi:hypothetical protein